MTTLMTPLDVLRRVQTFLTPEENWYKTLYATDRNNRQLQCCIIGAIGHVVSGSYDPVEIESACFHFPVREVVDLLTTHLNMHREQFGFSNLTDFNDNPHTTHADLLSFLSHAITTLESQI